MLQTLGFSDNMRYQSYHITYWPPPIPDRNHDYQFSHDDYDGPGDRRCGSAKSVEDAQKKIDEIEEELKYENGE